MKKIFLLVILFFVFSFSVVLAQDDPSTNSGQVPTVTTTNTQDTTVGVEVSKLQQEMDEKIRAIRAEYQPKIEAARKRMQELRTGIKEKRQEVKKNIKEKKEEIKTERKGLLRSIRNVFPFRKPAQPIQPANTPVQ